MLQLLLLLEFCFNHHDIPSLVQNNGTAVFLFPFVKQTAAELKAVFFGTLEYSLHDMYATVKQTFIYGRNFSNFKEKEEMCSSSSSSSIVVRVHAACPLG